MTTHDDWRVSTRVVHSGRALDGATGAVTPGIEMSTTFARGHDGEPLGGYVYGRYQNPNREALECCVSDLEGGDGARAFGSGSAAANALLQCFDPGTRVRYASDLYHGVRILMESTGRRAGLACAPVDVFDVAAVEDVIGACDVLWCETPSNPQLHVVDIARVARLCREAGVLFIVDSTFATPMLQRPLDAGADLVVHSTTKYLAGHGDVTGGIVVTRDASLPVWERLSEVQAIGGAVPSPFDCWLTLRGVSTLALRMKQHVANALEVATRLSAHPAVARTLYPGLPDHPQHQLASQQMTGPGGMVSIRLAGGEAAAAAMTGRLRWIPHATSLGGVHTLAEHRALVEPEGSPVPRDLVRLSIGIEDVDDIWADLEQALR